MTIFEHAPLDGLADDDIAELHRHQAANLTNTALAGYLVGVARAFALPDEVQTLIAEAATRLDRPVRGYDWSRYPGDDTDPTPQDLIDIRPVGEASGAHPVTRSAGSPAMSGDDCPPHGIPRPSHLAVLPLRP